ncbi:MAG: hypothetical protein HDR13_10750 [Lachnospiraceae bacterium]|nr:hypothetical protein [Lachnospiraceae bacterium]
MIRILTYKEHPRGKEIWDRYLYLAAFILPFPTAEVLGTDTLEVDGKTITAENLCQESGKRPRNRTKKYMNLLKDNKVVGGLAPSQTLWEQDYLLAAKLIWSANKALYAYLYQVNDVNVEPMGPPPIQRKNLRDLLTAKMDALPTELKRIGEVVGEDCELLLRNVFRYESFSDNKHAVKMLEAMDVNVCPYCNRLYTMTLDGNSGKSRPQFDHYKSKSKYPYFAVSLMNLVPSCGLCNQSKHDGDEEVLYPYSDEMGLDVLFHTKPTTGLNYLTGSVGALDEFSVALDIVNGNLPESLKDKIQNSDKVFNLTELYNKHKDYILYLYWKNYVFTDEYLEELYEEFPEVFQSFEDTKSMVYLMDISQKQWGRWSLGKLTHDIDQEIKETMK